MYSAMLRTKLSRIMRGIPFAIALSKASGEKLANVMRDTLKKTTNLEADCVISETNQQGAYIVWEKVDAI